MVKTIVEDPSVNKKEIVEKLISHFNSSDFTQIKKLFLQRLDEISNEEAIKSFSNDNSTNILLDNPEVRKSDLSN